MSIKRTLLAMPLVSAVILGAGLAICIYLCAGLRTSISATATVDYPVLDNVKVLTQDVGAVVSALKEAVGEGDKARLQQVGDLAVNVRTQLRRLAQLPGQAATAERLGREFEAYYTPAMLVARIMLELEEGDSTASIEAMQNGQKTLDDDLARTAVMAQARFRSGAEESVVAVQRVLYTTVAVAVAVIVGLLTVSLIVVRRIWAQLGGEPEYAAAIARAVADGDLSMPIGDAAQGSLLAALRQMQARLRDVVSEIRSAADTIHTSSNEIASGNAHLSERTESQASSLEETSSAIVELTQTVRQNAASASQANTLAADACETARRGGDAVHQVVATMDQINASAREIANISGLIDSIAFQTNILALNAAVEAARAGDQGRGFAVVASEVRALARRSADAAKEIKGLIDASVAKIGQGSELVSDAGRTMDDIVQSVTHVSQIIEEIARASAEQSTGIEEVSQAVHHMDATTQQNAALVEQASAATESLKDQAVQLRTALAAFKDGVLPDGALTRRAKPPATRLLRRNALPI